jgi:hypothetical protein
LFPDVLQVALVSAGVCAFNHYVALQVLRTLDTDGDGDVSAAELRAGIEAGLVEAHHVMGADFFTTGDMFILQDTQPFTLTALALGMMLTFRTQNCNARYTEARMLWGAMVNESRAVTSRVIALCGTRGMKGNAVDAPGQFVKCVMTFPHTLKYHLTVDGFCPDLEITQGMSDAEIAAVKSVALRVELSKIWDYSVPAEKDLVERMLAPGVASKPLHILHEMSLLNAQTLSKPQSEGGAGFDSVQSNEVCIGRD